MSLTIDHNRLAQQRALPPHLAQAETPLQATPTAAIANGSATPAPALTGGHGALTSDLLSVLLQEQSGATTGAHGSGPTLAGLLDAQDQTQAAPGQTGSAAGLHPSAAAQSAASTDNFMSGLQDLLVQLKAMG